MSDEQRNKRKSYIRVCGVFLGIACLLVGTSGFLDFYKTSHAGRSFFDDVLPQMEMLSGGPSFPGRPIQVASSSSDSVQPAPGRFTSTSDPFVNRSGVGLRDETEKITLAYDGQREKDQNTTVLELTIPPVAPKKTTALDEGKKEQSQQDTSTTWSQWVVMPLDCKHWFDYNTEKPAEFVLEVQYRDGSTVSHTEFKGSTFPVHQKAVWKFRFRNEGAADFIVVSHLQKL